MGSRQSRFKPDVGLDARQRVPATPMHGKNAVVDNQLRNSVVRRRF
jgi:hypothetical protein